ncbi:MAG: amidohydrolase family protein [Phycisphaerae bacterium]|nr:amidohydrolase family protein [Phycisphaerae bacterium]
MDAPADPLSISTESPAPAAPAPANPGPPAGAVSDFNRIGLDFRKAMPRPKVQGPTIDFHCHLLAAKHGPVWFEAAKHYGWDRFVTMTPLEEAVALDRDWPGRLQFIVVPKWQEPSIDDWLRRLEAFHNMGSRIIKFHMAPGTMDRTGWRLDSAPIRRVIDEAVARNMVLMSHIGDPDLWYDGKYAADAKFGNRENHYKMWTDVMESVKDRPWLGAHLGGHPENLNYLQSLLDRFPNLYLDTSATRWMQREISKRRDAARDFIIRNQDRLIYGSDQVSGDDRGFDFLASRFWVHRKLWETAYQGPSPIFDPDLPADQQPTINGLALPDAVLQKLYHDNGLKLLARVGIDWSQPLA